MSVVVARRRRVLACASLLAVAACGAPSARQDSVDAAKQSNAEAAVDQRAATDPPVAAMTPRASNEPSAVDAEFVKLLASLGVVYAPGAREITVQGWVNMQSGLVEVFACAPEGKTHESVVVLDCVPSGLQAGLLALGLEPGKPVEFGTEGQYQPPTGDGVEIEVVWRDAAGAEHRARAEDWVISGPEKQPMKHGAWIFAGSFLQPTSASSKEVTFAADYVKSLVTTYHDASSILENPWPEGIDDTMYYANTDAVPPVGTVLTAVFRPAK